MLQMKLLPCIKQDVLG